MKRTPESDRVLILILGDGDILQLGAEELSQRYPGMKRCRGESRPLLGAPKLPERRSPKVSYPVLSLFRNSFARVSNWASSTRSLSILRLTFLPVGKVKLFYLDNPVARGILHGVPLGLCVWSMDERLRRVTGT
jgi:hypothetical protein